MASYLISSSHHIDFDSIFGIDDAGLVQMFESLIATGLKNFLGCPAVFYEADLIEFFENSSVRDGMVVSTIKGKAVEISEEVFATTFELPTEGLTDLSEVPKNLFFDARILFSVSQEQVSISCFNKEMEIQYRLLSCLVEKYTRIGVGLVEITDSPKLKKTPAKKAVSLKRPAVDTAVAPLVKKKRTTKGKPVAMETVAVAQEAVPLQIFEATADAPVEQSPFAQKKNSEEKTEVGGPADDSIDEGTVIGNIANVDDPKSSEKEPVDEPVAGQQEVLPVVEASTDDPDTIIEKVLNQLDSVATTDGEDQPAETDEERQWFDLPYEYIMAQLDAERPVVTASGTDEEMEQVDVSQRLVQLREQLEQTLMLNQWILELVSLPVAQPVFSVAPRQPTVLGLRISQFCTVFLDYSLFSSLPTADIRSFVGSIASERTVLRNVQIIQASGSVAPRVQFLDDHPLSASTSEDSALNFDEIDTAATSTSLPAASIPKITEALAQLRASIEQIRERDVGAKIKDTLLLHLHDFERKFTARFDAQDRVLGALRKDSNDQRSLLSLDLRSSHKHLGTQIATTALDVVDVRRVVRENYQELNAKITSLDEQVAATRNDLLEFSAESQQTLNIITDQLGELVAYINRGGNDKKGQLVSSSRPQPPPDDQNRDSGIACGGGDTDRCCRQWRIRIPFPGGAAEV
ncbi:hypothetical protein F511_39191 [Dorcoceras hygrometricum]|uniref:Dystroglycan-like n=1 Tax=Dorcoceras hygrometricum TaxID=472368 RepID=A0A2Z7BY03_9LAMI|nr:hypothetical protein F511_39191 [Dorcoceras hygrometricum]